jgi:hypothetical protein
MEKKDKERVKSVRLAQAKESTSQVEQTKPYRPAINAVVQTTRQLEEEVWIREWETKNSRRSG